MGKSDGAAARQNPKHFRIERPRIVGLRWGTAAFFTALLFMCGLPSPSPALAAAPWNGADITSPDLSNDVYLIDSPAKLAGFRNWINTNVNSTGTYRLTADIDLGGKDWDTIGSGDLSSSSFFGGRFEGNGHTIRNFTIIRSYTGAATKVAGLFGYVSGDISDLSVTDFVISVDFDTNSFIAGGLAGQLRNNSSVTNCRAAGTSSVSIFSAFVSSTGSQVGGLVGVMNDNSRLENSSAAVSVSASSSNSGTNFSAGGLVGSTLSDSPSIVNCSAAGSVSVSSVNAGSSSTAGGLIGYFYSTGGLISHSYATGNVSVSSTSLASAHAGGFVGWQTSSGNIAYSYATGSVSAVAASTSTSANCRAGGFIGRQDGSGGISHSYATGSVSSSATNSNTSTSADAFSYAGGFAGYMDSSSPNSIGNCYATGNVLSGARNTESAAASSSRADSWAGGFVGYQKTGHITNSYATGRAFSSASAAAGSPDPQTGAFAGRRDSGASISGGFFDRQSAGTTAGVGSGDLVLADVRGKSSAEMSGIFADKTDAWKSIDGFYPQIAAFTEFSAGASSLDIRQMSAFSVLPMRFDTASANEDTSAAVAHSPLAPARTPGAAGLPVTWTCSPAQALRNGSWSGGEERIFAPQRPGPLAASETEEVSGSADLTAEITLSSGKKARKTFTLFFDGNYSDYAFTPLVPDISLTARYDFPDTPRGDLSGTKPFNGAILNDEGVPLEILLWGENGSAGADADFLLYDESSAGQKTIVKAIDVASGTRQDFHVVPRLNLPVGRYSVGVATSGDGKVKVPYTLTLNVTSDDESGEPAEVERLSISEGSLALAVGGTRTLYARLIPPPSNLGGRDVIWSVINESPSGARVITVISDDIDWPDLWHVESGYDVNAADTDDADVNPLGVLANSKLMITANNPGMVAVVAQVYPPLEHQNPQDSCVVKVSSLTAPDGGGGGGCSGMRGALPAAMIFFLPIAFFLLHKRRNII
jgi:hypothetical protein